jgi:hypothetical protein
LQYELLDYYKQHKVCSLETTMNKLLKERMKQQLAASWCENMSAFFETLRQRQHSFHFEQEMRAGGEAEIYSRNLYGWRARKINSKKDDID